MISQKFNCYQHVFCLIVLITASLSCSKEKEEMLHVSDNVTTYSFDSLSFVFPVLIVDSVKAFDLPGFMAPYYLEFFPDGQYIITTDRIERVIHLFDESGHYIEKFGREGRGPGEFTGVIRLHAGWDDHLYAYDSHLKRISRFKVSRDGFKYIDSYLPLQEASSTLLNIYVTEWGNFGVFRSRIDFTTGEEEFRLYKLDDEFNQVERLLTIPGNEKMPLDDEAQFKQYIDHMLGRKTLWDVGGEWFYHISSHSTVINKYNLKTGESITELYFNLEERGVNEETFAQLMEYSSSISSRFPNVKDAIKEVQILPLFQELVVYDSLLYVVFFDITVNELTKVIRINEQTKEVHYLNISQKVSRIQAGNKKLYGIEVYEGDFSFIKIIYLTDE